MQQLLINKKVTYEIKKIVKISLDSPFKLIKQIKILTKPKTKLVFF